MNLFNEKNTRCRSVFFQVLALVMLLIGSKGALAGSCTGGNQTFTLSLPESVAVPRDVPVGTLLVNWTYSNAATNLWSCTANTETAGGRGKLGPGFTSSTGQTYSGAGAPGGATYTVYATNVQGVGIVVAYNPYVAFSSYNWNGWRSIATGWSGLTISGQVGTQNVGGQIAVALVKTGPISGGIVSSVTVAQTAPVMVNTLTGQADSYVITPVTVTALACTTPDVTVPLGSHSRAELTGVNTYTASTSFNVGLNSCPAGMNSVKYRIDPVTSVANSAQSVVTLDTSSGATGVGVQLLDGNGSVFKLSTNTTFSSYDKSLGGSYTIPFKARYYQTGATVSPGTANTSMTFTMTYQ